MGHRLSKSGNKELTEKITDIYIIIMLFVFPLFTGFTGYLNITESKFFFFIIAAGVLILTLLVFFALSPSSFVSRFSPVHVLALLFSAVLFLSWIISPFRNTSFLGAGRFDGLVSDLAYLLIFYAISIFSHPKMIHWKVFALSISLCMLLSLLQLFGLNPMRLYPGNLTFYDSGIIYSGVFLGTIGNMNIFDAVICLSIPAFLCFYVTESQSLFLIPILLSIPVIQKAGGDGLKVSLILFFLCMLPAVLTSVFRIKRFLRVISYCLIVFAFSWIWSPSASNPIACRFSLFPLMITAFGVFIFFLSHASFFDVFFLSKKKLRSFFLLFCFVLIVCSILGILFSKTSSGTISEFRNIMHGQWKDEYGSSRVRIWRECLNLVKEYPILGSGPGTLSLRLNIAFSRFIPETGRTLQSYVDNAHNVYLGYLVDDGVIGLFFYIVFLIGIFINYLTKSKTEYDLPCLLSVFTCLVHEFFGLGLCLSEPILWILLGFLCVKGHAESNTEADVCGE